MKRDKLQHIKPAKNSFKIPKGYFDTVEGAVFAKLTTEKLSDKEGFSIPDSYFDTIENSVLEKIQEEKNIKSTKTVDEQTGFTIPENYLETVEDSVSAKLDNSRKQVKVIDFKTIVLKRMIPFVAAASVLLVVYLNYNSKPISFEAIASSEIEQWIEDDLITLDSYEIAEVYSDVELENSALYTEDETELLDYLNGTDVESLLLEN